MRRGLFALTMVVAFVFAVLVFSGHAQAQHAEGEGRPRDSLTEKAFDLTLWTIFVFVGLLVVLRIFAWKPMLEGLQKREQGIESAIEQARKDQEEAAALRVQHQQELDKVKEQERAIMEQAHRDGQAVKDRMVAEARKEIEEERERSRRENASEREQAMRELLEQTAQLATLVATKAIRRTVTLDDQRRLVDEAVAELNFTADGGSKA